MADPHLTHVRAEGRLPREGRRTGTVVIAVVVAAAGVLSSYAADNDGRADLRPALHWFDTSFTAVTWPVMAALAAISVLHYLAAAAVARAAAGVHLSWGELVAAQLAAAAANRVTPAGLGGGGVLARYMTRRGGLEPARRLRRSRRWPCWARSPTSWPSLCLSESVQCSVLRERRAEVPLLVSRLVALASFGHPTGTVLALVGALLLLVAVVMVRLPAATTRRLAAALRSFARAVAELAHHPGRMAALMGASAGTTLILAAGFAMAAVAGPPACRRLGSGR